jgi:hypothetical protein
MAPRTRRTPTKSRRKPQNTHLYATRREFAEVLAIIEQNSTRIDRLEDVFAMQAKERPQVKKELGAMRALLMKKRPKRRRR